MLELGLKTLIAYLLGSLMGALLVGVARGVEIREQGSGNAGGTNALRTQGFWFAAATVVIDVGKGWLAAGWLPGLEFPGIAANPAVARGWLAAACAAAAVTGHVWPLFHEFRGGKGPPDEIKVVLVRSHPDDLDGLLQGLMIHVDPNTPVVERLRQGVGSDPVIRIHGEDRNKGFFCLDGHEPRDIEDSLVEGAEDGIEALRGGAIDFIEEKDSSLEHGGGERARDEGLPLITLLQNQGRVKPALELQGGQLRIAVHPADLPLQGPGGHLGQLGLARSRVPLDHDGETGAKRSHDHLRLSFQPNDLILDAWVHLGGQFYGMGGAGFSGSFGRHMRGVRAMGLDVVFIFDATSSMAQFLRQVKTKIASLAMTFKALVPTARIGLVAYRDHKDDFVTKSFPLTHKTQQLEQFLQGMDPVGGGDHAEAVTDGLRVAINEFNWGKNSKKIILMIGDARPHPEVQQAKELVEKFKTRMGGMVAALDTSAQEVQSPGQALSWSVMAEFREIAMMGGGESARMVDEEKVIKQMVVLVFGTKWESYLDEFLKNL